MSTSTLCLSDYVNDFAEKIVKQPKTIARFPVNIPQSEHKYSAELSDGSKHSGDDDAVIIYRFYLHLWQTDPIVFAEINIISDCIGTSIVLWVQFLLVPERLS